MSPCPVWRLRTAAVLSSLLLGACAAAPSHPPARLRLEAVVPQFPEQGSSPVGSALECTVELPPGAAPFRRFQLDARLRQPPVGGPALYVSPAERQRRELVAAPARADAPVRASQSQRAADLYQAGGEALLLGDRATAEQAYRKALQLAPEHHDARVALAGLLLDADRTAEASSVVAAGLSLSPASPRLRVLQGRLWLAGGEDQRALEFLLDAPPPLNQYPEYHALLATLHQRLGEHASAAGVFRQLVQRHPGEGAWWAGLAISEEARGRDEEARQAYQRASATRLSAALRRYVDSRLEALED